MWQYDADANSSLDNDERYYFVHDDRWRVVATLRDKGNGISATLVDAFVYHAAGFAGRGGSSYIDSVIMRDAEKDFDFLTEGDDELTERTFYIQNWRADVVAIVDSDGLPIEEVRYSAYGTPTVNAIADVNHDGVVNATDASVWVQIQGGTAPTGVWSNDDLDRDGFFPGVTDDDIFFYARQSFASGRTSGYKTLSGIGSRKGYAGYEWDVSATMWNVRHRVLDSASGKWTSMDPMRYIDGVNLSEYVGARAVSLIDPLGLQATAPVAPGWWIPDFPALPSIPWQGIARCVTTAAGTVCSAAGGACVVVGGVAFCTGYGISEYLIPWEEVFPMNPTLPPLTIPYNPAVPAVPAVPTWDDWRPPPFSEIFCRLCMLLHDSYKAACKAATCPPNLPCYLYTAIVRASQECVEQRRDYIDAACQVICRFPTKNGRVPDHEGQLRDRKVAHERCLERQREACAPIIAIN